MKRGRSIHTMDYEKSQKACCTDTCYGADEPLKHYAE